jgi:SAM-dependent methyltransferase
MAEREQVSLKAQSFFNDLWARGDPWELETSNWEHERYARLIAMLDKPRYGRVLEIGCGAGTFTRRLAGLADKVLALDVSSEAVARARTAQSDLKQVEFRVGNIMDYNLREEEPWDLIVISETMYFLGWLYSFLMFPGCRRDVRGDSPGRPDALGQHVLKPANLFFVLASFGLTATCS